MFSILSCGPIWFEAVAASIGKALIVIKASPEIKQAVETDVIDVFKR